MLNWRVNFKMQSVEIKYLFLFVQRQWIRELKQIISSCFDKRWTKLHQLFPKRLSTSSNSTYYSWPSWIVFNIEFSQVWYRNIYAGIGRVTRGVMEYMSSFVQILLTFLRFRESKILVFGMNVRCSIAQTCGLIWIKYGI